MTSTSPSSKHNSSSSRHRSASVSSERSQRRMARHSSSNHRNPPPRKAPSAKTTPMHDDTDAGRLIPTVRPALAIDYLGNSWNNEDDIAASWKFMTKQKNDLINGLRLENASWRNWAKQRHNLKTVSPKTLNWLKDSDTTWLYGPLYKAKIDEFDLARFGAQTISGASALTATTPTTPTAPGSLKPALKHKTASELFRADTLFHVQSDLKLDRKIEPYTKAQESAVFKEHRQPKLRFNDSVEQCVAIDDAVSDDELNEEDEDEDDGIMMRISEKRPARSIVRINPTKLKAGSMHGMDPDDSHDEPVYTGNPYTESESSIGVVHDASADSEIEEAAIAEVSYTRPSPPLGSSTMPSGGGGETTPNGTTPNTTIPSPTLTNSHNNLNNLNNLNNHGPVKPGGIGQRAADIVANVKDIVHWASSLVYNSSTF
ncbi:hypothetical protein BGZ52_011463 [Haplosporangium bisporale]|nr:hypothetical protein BGZ52_011463 [Haplosporangium bisporale]